MVEIRCRGGTDVMRVPTEIDETIPDDPELIMCFYEATLHQTAKLEESNKLMRDYDPERSDVELQQAIAENEVAICRRKRLMDRCLAKLGHKQ